MNVVWKLTTDGGGGRVVLYGVSCWWWEDSPFVVNTQSAPVFPSGLPAALRDRDVVPMDTSGLTGRRGGDWKSSRHPRKIPATGSPPMLNAGAAGIGL